MVVCLNTVWNDSAKARISLPPRRYGNAVYRFVIANDPPVPPVDRAIGGLLVQVILDYGFSLACQLYEAAARRSNGQFEPVPILLIYKRGSRGRPSKRVGWVEPLMYIPPAFLPRSSDPARPAATRTGGGAPTTQPSSPPRRAIPGPKFGTNSPPNIPRISLDQPASMDRSDKIESELARLADRLEQLRAGSDLALDGIRQEMNRLDSLYERLKGRFDTLLRYWREDQGLPGVPLPPRWRQ
jgi:hypothetical protein